MLNNSNKKQNALHQLSTVTDPLEQFPESKPEFFDDDNEDSQAEENNLNQNQGEETSSESAEVAAEEETLDLSAPERKKKRGLKQKILIGVTALVLCSGLFAFCVRERSARSKSVTLPETATTQPARDGKKVVEDIYQPQAATVPATANLNNPQLINTNNPEPNQPQAADNNKPGGGDLSKPNNFIPTTLNDPKAPVTGIQSPPPANTANDKPNGVNASGGGGGRQVGSSQGRSGSSGSGAANDRAEQAERNDARMQTAEVNPRFDSANSASYVFKPIVAGASNQFNQPQHSILPASAAPASLRRSKAFEAGVKQIPFGTLLPVRTLGAIHTLFKGSLARLELTRTIQGENWSLPERTMIVARVQNNVGDRVFLQPVGFIYQDQLYPLSGEFTGTDGAAGLAGTRKQIGSDWYRTLFNIADQANKTLGTWLASRGGGAITNIQLPSVSQQVDPARSRVVRYVFVHGGTEGYLMSTVLPEKAELGVLPGNDDSQGANDLDESSYDLLEKALADPQSVNEPNQ